jgi:hypothetical protein
MDRYRARVVPDEWGSVREDLAADVRRVADRLRGLSQARLQGPVPPFASRAAAGREVARVLALAAQGAAASDLAHEPAWRQPPALADFAAGDQVAVTGHDLLAALDGVDPAADVWVPGGRRTAREVVAEAAEALAAIRRLL